MPRVSVILCSYNQAKYLADSIESVFAQTFDDWELVIIDNGSTDASHDIIRSYEKKDPRVRVILHDENGPITKRLNEAIRKSTGELISILYSDDYYLPHKLASQVAMFEELPSDYGVVYSPGFRLDVDTGKQWVDPSPAQSGWIFHFMLTHDHIIHPISPLCRRECFERFRFQEDFFVEGEGIYLRFSMKYRFHFDPEPTVVMRDHASNIGRAIRRNTETTFLWLDKLERDPEFPREELATLDVTRIKVYRLAGWEGIRVLKDPAWARRMAVGGLKIKPSVLLDPKVLATLALSFAPAKALHAINRVVDRAKGTRGHMNYVADERLR